MQSYRNVYFFSLTVPSLPPPTRTAHKKGSEYLLLHHMFHERAKMGQAKKSEGTKGTKKRLAPPVTLSVPKRIDEEELRNYGSRPRNANLDV